jgi:hypothetical protein
MRDEREQAESFFETLRDVMKRVSHLLTLTLTAPPNKVAQELTDLISIREVLGSNCDRDTGYAQ